MRLYDTPDDECMHNVASAFKSSQNVEVELPFHNPRKQTQPESNKRVRWVLVDVLLIAALLGGCAWYYNTTVAQSSTIDILARLEKTNIERTQAEQLNVEAEKVEESDEASSSCDSVFKKLLHAGKKFQEVEHVKAKMVHERLEATTEESERQKLERVRDHQERISKKGGDIHLLNSGGTPGSSQFRSGDIVEFYDPYSHELNYKQHTHLNLIPSYHVESSRSHGKEILYVLVCNNDGSERILPERFMRLYQPYEAGTNAMCNMGSFEDKLFLPCTVQKYVHKATRGPEVLHGTYEVRIGPPNTMIDSRGCDLPIEHVPVWKIRRFEPTRGTAEL